MGFSIGKYELFIFNLCFKSARFINVLYEPEADLKKKRKKSKFCVPCFCVVFLFCIFVSHFVSHFFLVEFFCFCFHVVTVVSACYINVFYACFINV